MAEKFLTDLNKVWVDQLDFNSKFFPKAETYQEQSRQTKELVLHLMSELDELLRTCIWKPHRKQESFANLDAVKNEITDIYKYLISLAIVWNISPEDMIADYWRKSMVCRQRYSEEFLRTLEGKIALIDIDGVLANYCHGFATWVRKRYPELDFPCEQIQHYNFWINAQTLAVDEQVFQEIKHRYRTERGKLQIPVYSEAKLLLSTLKAYGHQIVLLTSRPIDLYPNIYTDTLQWLKENGLEFDHLWWSTDKRETVLRKNIRADVRYAVDDDLRYVESFTFLGIPSFWVDRQNKPEDYKRYVELYQQGRNIIRVRTEGEVINHIERNERKGKVKL